MESDSTAASSSEEQPVVARLDFEYLLASQPDIVDWHCYSIRLRLSPKSQLILFASGTINLCSMALQSVLCQIPLLLPVLACRWQSIMCCSMPIGMRRLGAAHGCPSMQRFKAAQVILRGPSLVRPSVRVLHCAPSFGLVLLWKIAPPYMRDFLMCRWLCLQGTCKPCLCPAQCPPYLGVQVGA